MLRTRAPSARVPGRMRPPVRRPRVLDRERQLEMAAGMGRRQRPSWWTAWGSTRSQDQARSSPGPPGPSLSGWLLAPALVSPAYQGRGRAAARGERVNRHQVMGCGQGLRQADLGQVRATMTGRPPCRPAIVRRERGTAAQFSSNSGRYSGVYRSESSSPNPSPALRGRVDGMRHRGGERFVAEHAARPEPWAARRLVCQRWASPARCRHGGAVPQLEGGQACRHSPAKPERGERWRHSALIAATPSRRPDRR